MLLITTPTGNSGRHVLTEALNRGQKVRVLVRDRKKLSTAVQTSCEIVEGDLRDESVLTRAAQGVEGVFFCTPQSADTKDVAAYYRSFYEPAASCFAASAVRRVVVISGGRGNPDDLGPGGPLAAMEKAFDATGIATRHVRCGYFMENFLYMVPLFKFKGSFSLPLDPAYPLALESAEDIGKTAAGWLTDPGWTGQQGVAVPYGQTLSCTQIAEELTNVLGKKISFAPVTGEEYKKMVVMYGVSEAMGQCLKEMFEGIEHESISGASTLKQDGGLTLAVWAERYLKPELGGIAFMKRLLS